MARFADVDTNASGHKRAFSQDREEEEELAKKPKRDAVARSDKKDKGKGSVMSRSKDFQRPSMESNCQSTDRLPHHMVIIYLSS
jgi:hypothetical protein